VNGEVLKADERAFAMLNRTVPDDQVFAVKQRALDQVVAPGGGS
jgi:hypothetical protein